MTDRTTPGSAARDVTVRQARPADADAVAAFTRDTWERFDRGDYIPDVFADWVASDGPAQHTVVAELAGEGVESEQSAVVGCCQAVLLSAHEAWVQGLRVHPDYRGAGVGRALNDACFAWARDQGATLARNMVFSWNAQGLGASRAVGFDPRVEFRWARPGPDAAAGPWDARGDRSGHGLEFVADPDAAWGFWQRSDARDALGGLGLDPAESWALSEWTAERIRAAADGGSDDADGTDDGGEDDDVTPSPVLVVRGEDGTCGVAVRVRTTAPSAERERVAVYGLAAWTDRPAAEALFAAVARDAADCGADGTRVLIPETPRHVSDAAAAGVPVDDSPDFVFEADLTGR